MSDESEEAWDDQEDWKAELDNVKRHCRALMEHFDNVQIFVARHHPEGDGGGGTVNCTWGLGNWFARYGQIRQWVIYEENRMKPDNPDHDEREGRL